MAKKRNPGSYIGEAMREAKRVRKPAPMRVRGLRSVAWINEYNQIVTQAIAWTSVEARRLSAWLTRAAEWIEQEERDGR